MSVASLKYPQISLSQISELSQKYLKYIPGFSKIFTQKMEEKPTLFHTVASLNLNLQFQRRFSFSRILPTCSKGKHDLASKG